MTGYITGVATVPAKYKSESGKDIILRDVDIESAIKNSDDVPFFNTHEDTERRGSAFALRQNSSGGLYYGAGIDDPNIENEINSIFNNGGIPNVSVLISPTENAIIEEHIGEDGSTSYTASDWRLEHIALVESGRCKPEQGCGVFDYRILNSSTGETMTEEVNVDQLKLELSEIKQEVETKEKIIADLEGSVKDLELVLTEANQTIEKFETAELDEIRGNILKLDDSIESKDINGITDKTALNLMLSNLRDRASRATKVADEETEEKIEDVMAEFKAAAGRL